MFRWSGVASRGKLAGKSIPVVTKIKEVRVSKAKGTESTPVVSIDQTSDSDDFLVANEITGWTPLELQHDALDALQIEWDTNIVIEGDENLPDSALTLLASPGMPQLLPLSKPIYPFNFPQN